MYRVVLDNVEIGWTQLEKADPPMGVAFGKIFFHGEASLYELFLAHCRTHDVTVNEIDPEFEFIDTQCIPDLRVYRGDGREICGVGNHITGMKGEGYDITILGIPYPFYGEEFPDHVACYESQFGGSD